MNQTTSAHALAPEGEKLEVTEDDQEKRRLAFFNAARAEIILRVQMRDTALATYGTVVAAIFGLAQGKIAGVTPDALYVIPYLSLAFTLLVCQHHSGIANLSGYCANLYSNALGPIPYDASDRLSKFRRLSTAVRTLGHVVILLAPAAISLYLTKSIASLKSDPLDALAGLFVWRVGGLAIAAALVTIAFTEVMRRRLSSKNLPG